MFNRILDRVANRAAVPAPNLVFPDYKRVLPLGSGSVNEAEVLGIPAAAHATQILVNGVSGLPIHAYEGDAESIIQPRILERPNFEDETIDTMGQITYSMVMFGNAYCLLGDLDDEGYPNQYRVLHPRDVFVFRDLDEGSPTYGQIRYKFRTAEYGKDRVLHVCGALRAPGSLTGVGVLDYARQSFQRSIALEEYGYRQVTESAVPPAVLSVKVPEGSRGLSKEDADALADAYVMSRLDNRRPAVLPGDITLSTITFSPEQMEFLESRKFTRGEMAGIYNLPPSRLGADGAANTYSNITENELQFVRHSLMPYIQRIEAGFSRLLRPGISAKFNLRGLLEADAMGQVEYLSAGIAAGIYTTDEARAYMKLPPLVKSEDREAALAASLVLQRTYLAKREGVVSDAQIRALVNGTGVGLGGADMDALPEQAPAKPVVPVQESTQDE